MFAQNRGVLSFLAGIGFAFMIPYIWFFTWSEPIMGFVLAAGVIIGVSVPLLLFAIFNNHVLVGFISGMLVMSAIFTIVFSFLYYGENGIHSLIIAIVSSVSVYSLLYAIRQR